MTLDILEIIKRKKVFVEKNDVYAYEEYEFEGAVKALDEMINDIQIMSEYSFMEKYTGIVSYLKKLFESESIIDDEEISKLSFYNNEIVDVLQLIDPVQLYDLEED